MKQYVNKCFVLDLLRKTDEKLAIMFGHLTYSASKLWSVANYEVEKNGVSVFELKQRLKDKFFTRNLHSQSAQAVIEKLQVAWKNTLATHTKRPRYQPKDGHFTVIWKEQGSRIMGNKFRLPLSKRTKEYLKSAHGVKAEYVWIELPRTLSLDSVKIQQAELVALPSFRAHLLFAQDNLQRTYSSVNDQPQLD